MYFLLAFILSVAIAKSQYHNPINPDYNDLLAFLFDPSEGSDMPFETHPFGMSFSDEEDDRFIVPKPFKAVIRRHNPNHPSKQIVVKSHSIRPSMNSSPRYSNSRSERKQLQIIHKSEPFFRPKRRGSKKNLGEASRRIESKEYAHNYFSHRRPVMKAASSSPRQNGRSEKNSRRMMSKMGNRMESKPGEKVWRVQRIIIQPPMNDGPVWTWKAQGSSDGNGNMGMGGESNSGRKKGKSKKLYSIRKPRSNELDISRNRMHDGYNMPLFMKRPSPPKFPEYSRKKRPVEEPDYKKDPLESPWIRMAVAVALGALVTCGVYAIASLVSMCFPDFFSSNDDDILGSGGRPVRYVPVPVIQERKTETVAMV